MQNTTFSSTTERPAFRRQSGMIGGVASGLAHSFNLDVTMVRVALAIGLAFTGPLMFVAYLIMWMVVPINPMVPVDERPSSAPALLVGAVAIVIGLGVAAEILSSIPFTWIVIGGMVGYYLWTRKN